MANRVDTDKLPPKVLQVCIVSIEGTEGNTFNLENYLWPFLSFVTTAGLYIRLHNQKLVFLFLHQNINDVGSQKNHLIEMVLLNIQNEWLRK